MASGTGSFVGGGGADGNNLSGNTASGAASTVAGGLGNTASKLDATVAGGYGNSASGTGSFVGGGGTDGSFFLPNNASGPASTVGGGVENIAGGLGAFVGGGGNNNAGGTDATVGGGGGNIASTSYATVPGGANNSAGGFASFAAGQQAQAQHPGAFVWSDDSGGVFASTANNQFSARAAGGVRFFSNSGATLGVQLAANGTTWSTLSDRNAKDDIQPINVQDILEELVHMPISKWSYKDDPTQRRYIGPMAQDFHSAFGLGDDDKRINTLDSESVALAAIQGLNQKLEEKNSQIAELRHELAELKSTIQKVSEQVAQSKATPQPAANVHNQEGL